VLGFFATTPFAGNDILLQATLSLQFLLRDGWPSASGSMRSGTGFGRSPSCRGGITVIGNRHLLDKRIEIIVTQDQNAE
jgi:hypothetical protein